MRLIYHLTIISVVSAFQFSSNIVLAQDSCTFDNIINGNLGVDLNELNILSSEVNTNSITAVNGSSGSIDVICTNAATNINISSVTQSNNAAMTLSTFTTTLTGLSSNIISHDGGTSIAVPIGTDTMKTLEIDISATYNNILKPGNYSFIVNLEATP